MKGLSKAERHGIRVWVRNVLHVPDYIIHSHSPAVQDIIMAEVRKRRFARDNLGCFWQRAKAKA